MGFRVSNLESPSIWQAFCLSPILLSLSWSLCLIATALRIKPSSSVRPAYPVGSRLSLHLCSHVVLLDLFFYSNAPTFPLMERSLNPSVHQQLFSRLTPAWIMKSWLSICLSCFGIWLRSCLFRNLLAAPIIANAIKSYISIQRT